MSFYRKPELPRDQIVLFPTKLDEIVSETAPVRRFAEVMKADPITRALKEFPLPPLSRGRPPYDPVMLVHLCLYGLIQGIRSSRRLEAACRYRTDVMWLVQRQQPDHVTISTFIKDHAELMARLLQAVLFAASEAKVLKLEHVSIDGTTIEANASKSSMAKSETIERKLAEAKEKAKELQEEYARNDANEKESVLGPDFDQEDQAPQAKARAKKMHDDLAERMQQALNRLAEREEVNPRGSNNPIASTTDPDCRNMKDKKGGFRPNYNAQAATDRDSGLIVGTDVNDRGNDLGQLAPMVKNVEQNLGRKPQQVSADSGYNTGPDLEAMENDAVEAFVPESGGAKTEAAKEAIEAVAAGKTLTVDQVNALPKHGDKFAAAAFVYDSENDAYRCPAGATLAFRESYTDKKGHGSFKRRVYEGGPECESCPLASLCKQKNSKRRIVSRDPYEEARARMRVRMASPEAKSVYAKRAPIAETPFGYIKGVLGYRKFLRRGLRAVRAEWAAICTAYNIRKLMRVLPAQLAS